MKLYRNHRQLPTDLIISIAGNSDHRARKEAEHWVYEHAINNPDGTLAKQYFHPRTIQIKEFE